MIEVTVELTVPLTCGGRFSSDPLMEPYPHQFATALFSFLYHLASYDAGGEALVSCGMMEALLKVKKHTVTSDLASTHPFFILLSWPGFTMYVCCACV